MKFTDPLCPTYFIKILPVSTFHTLVVLSVVGKERKIVSDVNQIFEL